MYLKKLHATIALVCLLLAGSFLTFAVETSSAQTTSFLAIVEPAEPTIYSNVGQIIEVSFQAVWTYGDNSGQAIKYANVVVEVKAADGAVTDMFLANTTTTGFADFNYTSSAPQILTFTPIKLITADETELNSSLLKNGETALYGLQSEPLTVYWDTFDVKLESTSTKTLENFQVSVNVTYLLVPEEGLTIRHNDSQQEFFPKIAHGVNVTVNGATAEETAVPGVYRADVSTLMPTAYVLVKVSQDGWATAHKAFGFAHEANLSSWEPLAIIFASAFAAALSAVLFASSRKLRTAVSKRWTLPVLGGFSLILSSFMVLYSVLVWFEGALHGFEWLLYGVSGLFSCSFGLLGGVMAVRRKNQTVTLGAVSLSLFANVIAVHASVDAYQLPIPWALILPTLAFSVISGLAIGNADDQFQNLNQNLNKSEPPENHN
jgi:hypothetical protein